jgi:aryl carrier-like protein
MTGVIAAAEATLCQIFADVLGLDLVRPQDGFFDVGGDSVLALQVVARAREAGLALSVRELFDHQTPGALAAVTGDLTDAPATAAPLLTFSADELAEFEDADVDQQADHAAVGWGDAGWEDGGWEEGGWEDGGWETAT